MERNVPFLRSLSKEPCVIGSKHGDACIQFKSCELVLESVPSILAFGGPVRLQLLDSLQTSYERKQLQEAALLLADQNNTITCFTEWPLKVF